MNDSTWVNIVQTTLDALVDRFERVGISTVQFLLGI